ncbi:unnamed protein product [Heterosigma akashiwo]
MAVFRPFRAPQGALFPKYTASVFRHLSTRAKSYYEKTWSDHLRENKQAVINVSFSFSVWSCCAIGEGKTYPARS